ncbi:hypothetical protein R3X25_04500 [Lutibacter sp. TH_r2]|uniref:hypothetical protein n=1 Tax=Lutibacter sp. TH_r2 TaxID=3082083 RepID=UPI002954367E|nr:hypothetical protein [Lutibacter sp. TH_r2]MDV7186532.1 hypothetical protein [Lutibacter sp. TH_r2]
MIIKYQSFINKNLLVIKYEGEFCIEKYKNHIIYFTQQPEWEFIDKVLIDLRFCELNLKIEDLYKIAEIKKNFIKKKHASAQLVDKPMITALVHLLKNEFNSDEIISLEYCSTINKLIQLLNLDSNQTEIDFILNNLKYTF